ncbi:MAG: uracil-DNA glycosylase [Pigeon pea little leaf phytoplasma]|uniref:Uracil-DNA glycosylase n=1 Tax=Candidatus Phytoplasma fabacearum TaxID=2982628 RepID=A0ABU8ZS18_9MOLU|nr:uracil-DNA glycosylase ['Bituminaria bituminosa' little leaf phytoplasma]MDV3148833.1 uracil-DNA glycosylase [Pigeon pea little leaf phytoplasma]MDO7983452.1 uracil-DNA glycosylase ['Bituminaria bituminosa' little leaf phytoplasma]MDO8023769.1 uracil-DNA glycosylase ['Bituminaria bituminosa' little leaf phytoplasma]MDO8030412.1 uracil-DNA glycosylase ['Bituminaria bituminosa' little leaf phytoplasma]MDV3153982.1 uracil-DNA glycosylase [Pigeon pea little leaf phytoplasma]
MLINIDWEYIIDKEQQKNYFLKIKKFLLLQSKLGKKILPNAKNIFTAFKFTSWEKVKVVILGQDPYPGPNQAHGLAFSTLSWDTPKSLKNIFIELQNDLSIINFRNQLFSWAYEGVLLLNTILTVEQGFPLSHKNIGWHIFIINIFNYLSLKKNIVYILWGKKAQEYKEYINIKDNLIIESSHPSPLSAYQGFFGSKPFSRTNEYLKHHQKQPINWNLH